MMEVILSVVLTIIVMVSIAALSIWIMKACKSCNHSYERIDDYNDKRMVLVCRRCGKTKRLRK